MNNQLLLKTTMIYECFCPSCFHGQVNQILEISFSEKIPTKQMIGREITCEGCQQVNIIKDEICIIPTETLVMNSSDVNKYKRDKNVKKWLERD